MAEGKDIGIHIKTTADTSGVDKADDSIKQLKKTTAADIEAMTDKVKVAQWGFYDLDSEIRKTAKSSESFTSGVTKMEKPTRDNAAALLAFSQGFEDAQFGIRGVLNNIPSLIFAMGGGAGLAGAISIAAVAGSTLFDMLTKTEEKSSVVADRIQKIAKAIGDADMDRFDEMGKAIQTAAGWADALNQKWTETKKAEGEYAEQALDNAAKLDKAQMLIAQVLGEQLDQFKELEKIAEREAEKRQLATEKAIEQQIQRRADAQEAAEIAAKALTEEEFRLLESQAGLINLRAELQLLREKREELEKIAKQVVNAPIGGQFGVTLTADQVAQNNLARDARKQLKDPNFQQEIATTQERVDRLEAAIQELAGGGGTIERLEIAAAKATTNVTDVARSVEIKIAEISETAKFDEALAKVDTFSQKSELFAQELSASFGKIETNNAKGIAAKETIEKAAEDGRITAEETAAVAEATRTLLGQVQSGIATTGTNIQDLLRLQTAFVASQESIADRVKALEARINQLNQR
jgi:hypothetical protein